MLWEMAEEGSVAVGAAPDHRYEVSFCKGGSSPGIVEPSGVPV